MVIELNILGKRSMSFNEQCQKQYAFNLNHVLLKFVSWHKLNHLLNFSTVTDEVFYCNRSKSSFGKHISCYTNTIVLTINTFSYSFICLDSKYHHLSNRPGKLGENTRKMHADRTSRFPCKQCRYWKMANLSGNE